MFDGETIPLCSGGHGLMIPTGRTFCLLSDDREEILATVEYYHDGSTIHAHVYAPMNNVPADLPLPDSDTMGEQIQMLQDAGRLVSAGDIDGFIDTVWLYNVNDKRSGASWQVSFDGNLRPWFRPFRPYVYQPDGKPDPDMTEVPPIIFSSTRTFREWLEYKGGYALVDHFDQVGSDRVSSSVLAQEECVVFDVGAIRRSR